MANTDTKNQAIGFKFDKKEFEESTKSAEKSSKTPALGVSNRNIVHVLAMGNVVAAIFKSLSDAQQQVIIQRLTERRKELLGAAARKDNLQKYTNSIAEEIDRVFDHVIHPAKIKKSEAS